MLTRGGPLLQRKDAPTPSPVPLPNEGQRYECQRPVLAPLLLLNLSLSLPLRLPFVLADSQQPQTQSFLSVAIDLISLLFTSTARLHPHTHRIAKSFGRRCSSKLFSAASTILLWSRRLLDAFLLGRQRRVVFAELKSGREGTEVACVNILGRMLARDAGDRWSIEDEDPNTWAKRRSVDLDPDVLDELLSRGERAERSRLDAYVIALTQAVDGRTKDFLLRLLRGEPLGGNSGAPMPDTGTEFHAAVGLAQLGHAAGIEWLIEHVEGHSQSVRHAWPWNVPDHNLSTCSLYALRALSGEVQLRSQSDWRQWWEATKSMFQPRTTFALTARR